MTFFPEEPEVPLTQRAKGRVMLRYEEISQAGKVLLSAMPVALGPSIWRAYASHPLAAAMMADGVLPILSRLVLVAGDGPIGVLSPVEAEGSMALAHTAGEGGDVERIVLNMWCRLYGEAGRTHLPAPPNAGARLLVGRVFAEHVMTRPFAKDREARKVLRLPEVEGVPVVPPDRYEWRAAEDLLDLPEGAAWLDDGFAVDPAPVVFGLDHTDSNQHVNSLVYPRVFLEAALRRLWDSGRQGAFAGRCAELAYRKPCFAGERLRIVARAYERGDDVGVAGALITEEEARGPIEAARPRCFARMGLQKG
jgi:hypothetical protein